MRVQRLGRRLTLAIVILSSALATGVMSTQASGSDQPAADRAKSGGVALVSRSTTSPVRVDSQVITEADFREQVQIVQSNVAFMHEEIAAKSLNAAYLQKFITIINAHGVANVALASLIENRSVYLLAVARGYQPSQAEVTARVEEDRGLAASGKAPAETKAFITAVGEQYYWATLDPEVVRRALAIQAFHASVIQNSPDMDGQVAAWQKIEQQAVAATRIEVLDSDAIAPATPDAALAYLRAYWAFQGS